jgi:deoxyribonuclease-4
MGTNPLIRGQDYRLFLPYPFPSWSVTLPMIYLGPAGVPLSCKGRTTLEGVEHTQDLGLNAMEIQFVRGIQMDEEYALEVGEVARRADIRLGVHSPYYTNIASDDEETIEKSVDKIAASGYFGDIMDAEIVVAHTGFFTSMDEEETRATAIDSAATIRDHFDDDKFVPDLGLEVMGKKQTYGDLDEIITLCQEVDGIRPVIDFAHVHARSGGGLQTADDFHDVFDKLEPLDLDHIHSYFTGVVYEDESEVHHTPIKKSDLDPEPLYEAVLERDLDITIISNSPLVEHDAMELKLALESFLKGRDEDMEDVYPAPAPLQEAEA